MGRTFRSRQILSVHRDVNKRVMEAIGANEMFDATSNQGKCRSTLLIGALSLKA